MIIELIGLEDYEEEPIARALFKELPGSIVKEEFHILFPFCRRMLLHPSAVRKPIIRVTYIYPSNFRALFEQISSALVKKGIAKVKGWPQEYSLVVQQVKKDGQLATAKLDFNA